MSFLDRIKNLFRSPFEQATTAAINAGNVWAATAAVQQTIPFQDAQQQVYNDTWVNQALNAVDNTLLAISPQLELEFQTPQEAYQIQPLDTDLQNAIDINREADAVALSQNVALSAADVINNPQDYDNLDLQNRWEQLWQQIWWDWFLGSLLSNAWWLVWAWLDFVWDNFSWVADIATGNFKEWFNTLVWAWTWLVDNIIDSFWTSEAESKWMWENYQEYLNKVAKENAGITVENFFTWMWKIDWATALVKSWIDYTAADYIRYELPYFWWKALQEDRENNEVNIKRLGDIVQSKNNADDPILLLANGQITPDQYENMWGKNLTDADFIKAWYKWEDDFLDKQRFFSVLDENQKTIAAKIIPKTWVDRDEIVENISKQKAYTTQFFWWEDYKNVFDSLEWEAKAKFSVATKQNTEFLWRQLTEYNRYLANWTKRTNEWSKEQKDVFDAYSKTTSFLKENVQYQMIMEMEARAKWIENPNEYANQKYKAKFWEDINETRQKRIWEQTGINKYISPEDYMDRTVKKATLDSDGRWQNLYSDTINKLSLASARYLWDTTEFLVDAAWVNPSSLQRLELQPNKSFADNLYANADVVGEIAWSILLDKWAWLIWRWILSAWAIWWAIAKAWRVWELISDAALTAGKVDNFAEFSNIERLWNTANAINVFDNVLQSQRQNIIYGSLAQSMAGEPYNPAIDWVMDIMLWWPFDLLDAARAYNKSISKWISKTESFTFNIWGENVIVKWDEAINLIKEWNTPIDWFKLTSDQMALWALLKSWDSITEKNLDSVKAMYTIKWDAAIDKIDQRMSTELLKAPKDVDWVAYVDAKLQKAFANWIARKRFAEIMEAGVKSWDLTWYLKWAEWEISKIETALKRWTNAQEVANFLIPHRVWEEVVSSVFDTSWLLGKLSKSESISNFVPRFTFNKAPSNTISTLDKYKAADRIITKIDNQWWLLWVIPSKTLQSELWQETIDEYVKFGKLAPNIWRDWAIDAYRVVNNENYKTLLETAWESDTKFFDAVKTVMVNNWLSDVANDKVVWVFSKLTKVLCV